MHVDKASFQSHSPSMPRYHHNLYMIIHHPSSFLHIRPRRLLTFDPPPRLLVPSRPLLLHIAQRLLDFIHRIPIPRVLPHVIANLDGRTARGRGEFDDDVERCGFAAVGGVGEVV